MLESRKKTAIIVLAIAVTISIVLSTEIFTPVPAEQKQTSNSSQTSSSESMRQPAPALLTAMGTQVDSFEHATSVAGLPWASLPTYMPANLTLQSTRVKGNGMIWTIYTPPGITASDNDTDQKIWDAGSVDIMYLLQDGGPTANLTQNMEIMTKDSPNLHLENINNHQALVFPNEIQINAGNCMNKTSCWLMVDIESEKFNSTDLRSIAQSISIPPAGSSGISQITLNSLHSSLTFVSANQTTGHIGTPIILKAVVSDTNMSAKIAPVGTIVWDDGGAGGRFAIPDGGPNISICDEIHATSDSYQCTATYTPSKTGQITMTATYYGDITHHTSSGALTLKVS